MGSIVSLKIKRYTTARKQVSTADIVFCCYYLRILNPKIGFHFSELRARGLTMPFTVKGMSAYAKAAACSIFSVTLLGSAAFAEDTAHRMLSLNPLRMPTPSPGSSSRSLLRQQNSSHFQLKVMVLTHLWTLPNSRAVIH